MLGPLLIFVSLKISATLKIVQVVFTEAVHKDIPQTPVGFPWWKKQIFLKTGYFISLKISFSN